MLKTFGVATFLGGANGGKQVRAIVAAPSQRKAAELLEMSLYEFRLYAAETGNQIEIQTATSAPGQIFWQHINAFGRARNEWCAWVRSGRRTG